LIPSGVLIIDKDSGPTSHDVVSRVRRAFGIKRVGHAGTLDPFATGVLVVLVGRATLLSQFLISDTKRYRAYVRWGTATDTMDLTGAVVGETDKPAPGADEIKKALENAVGEIDQIPPMYSAKKIDGVSLHKLARKGVDVPRKSAKVRIDDLRLVSADENGFEIDVTCSKGTYIRTLADSLARALGGFGHLSALRRTASGEFSIDRAVRLDNLAAEAPADPDERRAWLHTRMVSMEKAVSGLKKIAVDAAMATRISNGIKPAPGDLGIGAGTPDGLVRIIEPEGNLLAVARVSGEGGAVEVLRVFLRD
jgi:tRNA pseudouridine55 synthase